MPWGAKSADTKKLLQDSAVAVVRPGIVEAAGWRNVDGERRHPRHGVDRLEVEVGGQQRIHRHAVLVIAIGVGQFAIAVRHGDTPAPQLGVGFGNGTDLSTLGALRSLVGTNTWTGNIDFAGDNNLIGVNTGGTLNLTGVISNSLSRGSNLYKVGEGTLQLTGTQANVYRGTTRVLQGTLELGKTAGLDAVGGSVVIGDDIEASGTKTLRLLAANQIRHLDQYDTGVLTCTV